MIDKLIVWSNTVLEFLRPWLVKIILAIIIVLLGLIAGKLLNRVIKRMLHEFELDLLLRKAAKLRVNAEKIISDLIGFIVVFVSIVFALETIGWGSIVVYIILIFLILIVLVSFILGIKDFFPNIISGLVLQKKKFVCKGDYIKVISVEGEVIYMNLIEVKIRTEHGDEIVVPNSVLVKNEVIKLKKKPLSVSKKN